MAVRSLQHRRRSARFGIGLGAPGPIAPGAEQSRKRGQYGTELTPRPLLGKAVSWETEA